MNGLQSLWKPPPGVQITAGVQREPREPEKKNKEKESHREREVAGTVALTPYPPPTCCFSCSHLFVSSPQSEQSERQ